MIISHQELDSMHIDLDIETLSKRKSDLEKKLHHNKESVRIAILEWIDKEVREVIKDAVIKEYDNTESLGEERLAELKSKSKEIPDKARLMIGEFLSKDSVWQLEDSNGIIYSSISSKPTESLDKVIRSAIGLVGALLIEYNYLQDNWINSGGSISFRYGYQWDSSINKKMDELHTIVWLLNDINKRIENTISDDKKAKAKYLWEKA